MTPTGLPPRIFDRDRIARHLSRRAPDRDDFVTRLVHADLAERLGTVTRQFTQALVMAPAADLLPGGLASAEGPFTADRVTTVLGTAGIPLVDPEALDLPGRGYDLIVSLFDLDVVNDVPGFLARARAHLREDGLFMAAAIGGDSLTELREAFLAADAKVHGGAYLRVSPFIPLADAAGLLQRAGLALPVADVETHVVRYESPLRLMAELKTLGAANPLADRPRAWTTRTLLRTVNEAYSGLAADPDGRVRATLELIWMSGWAPNQSQQKPLKPGSAKVSLVDILGKN